MTLKGTLWINLLPVRHALDRRTASRLWSLLMPAVLLLGGSSRAGELAGRVTNAETGQPVEAANVHLLGTDRVVATDKRGHFTIAKLPDGTYFVIITHVAFDSLPPQSVSVNGIATLDIPLSPQPWVLDEVVVTGTRSPHLLKDVPVPTEVVTRRDFQRTGAKTVDEALASSIGLTIGQDFSGQGATIRGVQQDRVLVMVDGERMVGRVNGSLDLSQVSLTTVEKIEVVKGAGSTLYGSDAIGGVINIITKRPRLNTGQADLAFDYGSHTTYNPALDLQYGSSRIAVTLGAKLQSSDGFDLDGSTPHTNGEAAVDRVNLSGKLHARLSPRWSLGGSARFMNENLDWIESEVRALSVIRDTTYIYDDEETNRRYEGSTTLEYLSGDTYQMKLRLYGSIYQHNWNKYGDNRMSWIDTSETEDRYFEAAYSSNYVIGAGHVATYGVDLVYQDLESTDLTSAKEADRSAAAYFQYEYSPIKQVTVLPGVRWESHSSFGSTINPSINIMYQPSESLKLRGSVGRGYRAPSIKQQYFIFDHTSAGYIVYGGKVALPPELASGGSSFEQLVEEHSINSSISAELSYGAIGLHRITWYYNHLEDLIDFTLIGFTPTYWRGVYVYQNVESAMTQGVEWESRVRLARGIDVQFSYSYLFSRNLETGGPLVGRPDHTLKLFLSGYHERLGVGATFWGDWQSRKVWVAQSNTGGNEDVEGSEEEYAPGRTRLNLNLFKRIGSGFEAFLRVENLLDETDLTYGYWPGRQVVAGFTYGLSFIRQ